MKSILRLPTLVVSLVIGLNTGAVLAFDVARLAPISRRGRRSYIIHFLMMRTLGFEKI